MKKNVKDLEAMIDKRANALVQEKIYKFKKSIELAIANLVGIDASAVTFGNIHRMAESKDVHKHAVAAIAGFIFNDSNPETGNSALWPSILWERERDAIREELMAKMDLMQQLLMAKPRDTSGDVVADKE